MSQTDPFAPLQRGPSRRRPDGEAPRVGVPRPSAVPPESSDDVFGRLPRASVPTVADAELVVPSRRARREAERRGTAEQPVVAASVSGGAVPGGAVPEGDGDVPDGGAPLPVPSVPRPRNRWVSVALVVVSMLMAAVSVATVLPVASGLVAAAAGLAPLLLVPGLVVVAWAVHTRRHVSCVLACVAALLPWLLVGGYVTAAPPPPTGAPGLRVMLVNGAGGEADAADIVAQAQGQGASLLVVTELTDLLAHDLTTAGIGRTMTPRWVGDAASGRGRTGLWSRDPVEQILPVPGTRAALTATVITEQGPVGLVLAHASRPARPGLSLSDSEDWADDLHDIAVAAAAVRGPKLLVGDLQAGPWHADYRRLEATSGMDDAADALGRGLRPTWPSWNGLAINPLDHVLIGGGVRVRYVGTASVGGSAHLALVTEVTVPAAPRG